MLDASYVSGVSLGKVRSLGHKSGTQTQASGETQSTSESTVLEELLNTSLLLQLSPRWCEMKPVEEALRRFMCQANPGFSHNPVVCVDHADKLS